ncbi:MAG TPA: acyl-CoA dehydrogenase family protein [Bacillota bacterium]
MADFTVAQELASIRDSLIEFIDNEVVPLEQEHKDLLFDERRRYDARGRLAPEVLELKRRVRMRSAELGYYTLFGDAELGGAGLGVEAVVVLFEALYRRYGPGRVLIDDVVIPSLFTNGLSPVLRFLPEHLRQRYLPAIASGEKTLCFALTEPDAGSDVWNLRTRAVRDGDHWVINGSKQFITNGPYADYCMLFAVTNPELKEQRKGGITGFFVDTSWPGFRCETVLPIMGQLGGEIAILHFDDLRVPADHVLGEVDHAFHVAFTGIDKGRVGIAAKCLGLSLWALDQAVAYAGVRRTFGRPIGDHGQVQALLADCAIEIYALKSMLQNVAWRIDRGETPVKEISIVKAFGTEAANRIFDRCMQVHGGMGLTNQLRLVEGYRWARSMRIPDGTTEIQRRTIARRLLRGDTDF